VIEAVRQQMRLSQQLVTGEIYLDGMTNVLAEPEFLRIQNRRAPPSPYWKSAASWTICFPHNPGQ
jgi:hypothetical protein